jgi:CO/xanthine dehydrogenase Mo-binding subunit
MHQALGYALTEELVYDDQGRTVNPRFDDYRVFRADESPPMQTLFVETFEPSHPVGVKSVAEIVVNGVAPAVINAIHDATGVMMTQTPVTPSGCGEHCRLAYPLPGRGAPESVRIVRKSDNIGDTPAARNRSAAFD